MITIPTADFTGIINDCLPFAYDADDELPALNAIRVDWDGHRLHASATDRYRMAVSTYDPLDLPEHDSQDALGTEWGGADDPWSINLPLADAAHLAKVFKLAVKFGHVPVVLDAIDGRLKVRRDRESGHPATTVTVDGQMEPFPDLRTFLVEQAVPAKVCEVAFSAKFLADFARVRPRGPMEMTFTGETRPCIVTIGERFTGAIMPTRVGKPGERDTTDPIQQVADEAGAE